MGSVQGRGGRAADGIAGDCETLHPQRDYAERALPAERLLEKNGAEQRGIEHHDPARLDERIPTCVQQGRVEHRRDLDALRLPRARLRGRSARVISNAVEGDRIEPRAFAGTRAVIASAGTQDAFERVSEKILRQDGIARAIPQEGIERVGVLGV